MRPFVVNGHDRLVFPSNFSADLDFSVLETLDQLAAVIRRDFEAKAPTGTEILERVDSDGYRSRYELLRDLAMNLVWGNRYAMTMYEKRPTRWRDLPRRRDDVFLPLLTPWEHGERKVAAVAAAWSRAPPHVGRRSRGPDLHDPVRHLPPQAPPRDRAPAGEADRGGDHERSDEPHLLLPDARPGSPDPQLPGDPRLHGGGARARAAPPLGDGPPQPVPVGSGPRRGWWRSGRIGDDDFVVAFVPRNHEVLEFIRRVKAGRPARAAARTPAEAREPVEPFLPVVVREQFALMPRLESLAVVKGEHVCTNEDLIRNAAYSWSPMTADEIQEKTGIEERLYTERRLEHISLQAARAALEGAGRRPEEIGAVIFCSCTSTRLIPSVATWLSGQLGIFQTHGSFDLVAACAGFPYGLAEAVRLLQEVKRPVLVVCAEKFSDKIGSVRPSRMIFGDGASALVVGPAAPGAAPDIEVVQIYASGPVSQVNSIIWPNPEFDNNITVYGPEVKALVERYLTQMMGELRALPDPDGGGDSLLDAHRHRRSPPGQQDDGRRPWRSRRAFARRSPLLQRREGGQRLRRQHPARDLRRGSGGRDRPADAGVHAGLRGRRGGRLHGHPRRPRRSSVAEQARAGRPDDRFRKGTLAPSLEDVRAAFGG